MNAHLPRFKPGDITKDIWSGDIVTECEFIQYLDHGTMLFHNKTARCFVRAFWEVMDDGMGKPITVLNGWDCSSDAGSFINRVLEARFK